MKATVILPFLPLALGSPTITRRQGGPAPILRARDAQLLPDQYIVKLKDGSTKEALERALELFPGDADKVYGSDTFKGFATGLDADALMAVQNSDDVEFIEQDVVVTVDALITQTGAPWGLGRISSRTNGTTTYVYDESAGDGTCAYIIDTGIYIGHSEFGGRATFAANFIDTINDDGYGHGTHVAGTIGGATYGVAKKTKLFAVKVLDSNGFGSASSIIAGMDFVATDSQTRDCPNGSVANASLRSSVSAAMNAAAKAVVDAGVFFACSAGNSNIDSSNQSPGSEPTVCTVGATQSDDVKASYSNFGPGVDIYAPGTGVLSAYIGNPNATLVNSGTSMATPHIVGLGAYMLTLLGPKTPQAMCEYLKSIATMGVITGLPSGTVNQLAFNGNA